MALIAGGRLTDVLRRVATFGVTLATIDIRQASDRHTEALDAITRALGLGSYAEWDESKRLEFLVRELPNPRPLIPPGLNDIAGRQRCARHVPHDRADASRIARQLRRHDDASGVRRPRRRVAPERDGRGAAASCRATARDGGRPAARSTNPRSTLCDRLVSRAHQRPAGGHGRLLRLGEGRRTTQRRAGSCSKRRRRSSTRADDITFGPRCFTGAAAVSVAAVGPPISRCNRSPREQSMAGFA